VVAVTITLWMVHLVGMAVLTSADCAGIGMVSLHGLTVVTLVPTVALAVWAWRGRTAPTDSSIVFLAELAAFVAAANAFVIVAEWIPVLLLEACG
jgi:hypothetical protein